MDSRFKPADDAARYDEAGLSFRPNEYDLYAMEQALRVREDLGEAAITVVSVGPPRVEAQLRRVLGMGGDYGVIIDDSDDPAPDALSIASLIGAWAGDKDFDLILCGVMSEDMQRSQTGPALAETLGIPSVTTAVSLSAMEGGKFFRCERELEGGVRERFQVRAPALFAVQSGINSPRYPSLSNVLRVKRMEIPRVPAGSLGAKRPPGAEIKVLEPRREGKCEFLEGGLEEIADALIERMREVVPSL